MNPPPSVPATKGTGGLRYVKLPGLAHRANGEDEHYFFIMSMAKDRAGDLWMATYGAGVWRYDGKDLKHYPVIVGGEPITVFSISCDREGQLWLGTHEHGVCKFNGKSFERFKFRQIRGWAREWHPSVLRPACSLEGDGLRSVVISDRPRS